jgi:hypothetical protein
MAWNDLLFDDSEGSDALDEELDEILKKIDKINDLDEEGNQKKLIKLCDSALKLTELSQPGNTKLIDLLYWLAGYSYLELAEDFRLIEKGLSYINMIANRQARWHLAYAQIHFFLENFEETQEHLNLVETRIEKDIESNSIDDDGVEAMRQLCLIGHMRTYLATEEIKKYDSCVADYIKMISKNGTQTGVNHFVISQDIIRFDSNVEHLSSLVKVEDGFCELLALKEAMLSQISFLQGNIEESDKHAYEAKIKVTNDGALNHEIWQEMLDDENDKSSPKFTIGGFECPLLDSPPGVYCLMEERSINYSESLG